MIRFFFSFLLLCSVMSVFGKQYRTETFSNTIKSLQVNVMDNWELPPVIEMGGDKFIEIKFDEMSHEYKHLTYSIIHCNADWTPSNLTPIEFMQGFQNMAIDDYLFSFNTTMPYTNYRMVFPNENAVFKVSGNYVVEVFDADKQGKLLLSACFSVVEPSGPPIRAKMSTNTDVDFNKAHQQLSFSINCRQFRITSPQQELKVYVQQNNRIDNTVKEIQPTSILNNEYTYQHNRKLIFEAGNEYRRFEMTTTAYKGSGIDALDFHEPYYHVTLFRDDFRARKAYVYDQDQNGRYFVRCVQGENYDNESDYFFVHFSLDSPEPLLNRVYIQSEAFNNILDERSEMQYDRLQGAYVKTALLKQGSYNYQYLTKENSNIPNGNTAIIEGNFYETENEYLILVYYRGLGERYDRLVGELRVKN